MNNEKSETHIHKLPTRHSFQSSLAWKPLSYSKLFGVYGGVIQIALRSYSSRQLCRPVLSAWLIVALGSSCRLLQPDPFLFHFFPTHEGYSRSFPLEMSSWPWPDHHSSNFSGPRCLKHEPWGWDTSSACEVCSSLSSFARCCTIKLWKARLHSIHSWNLSKQRGL